MNYKEARAFVRGEKSPNGKLTKGLRRFPTHATNAELAQKLIESTHPNHRTVR